MQYNRQTKQQHQQRQSTQRTNWMHNWTTFEGTQPISATSWIRQLHVIPLEFRSELIKNQNRRLGCAREELHRLMYWAHVQINIETSTNDNGGKSKQLQNKSETQGGRCRTNRNHIDKWRFAIFWCSIHSPSLSASCNEFRCCSFIAEQSFVWYESAIISISLWFFFFLFGSIVVRGAWYRMNNANGRCEMREKQVQRGTHKNTFATTPDDSNPCRSFVFCFHSCFAPSLRLCLIQPISTKYEHE